MITLFLPLGHVDAMRANGLDIGTVHPMNASRIRLVTTREKIRMIRADAESRITADDGGTYADQARSRGLAQRCLNALSRQGY